MAFGNRVAAARASAAKPRFVIQPKGGRNNEHLITDEEIDQYSKRRQGNGDEKGDESDGVCFRYTLFTLVFLGVVLLLFMRADIEYNVLPSLADGTSKSSTSNGESAVEPLIDPVAAKYYAMLNLDVDAEKATETTTDLNERERRRERHRLKKAAKRAYEGHLEEQNALVTCGRSCEARHKQMQLAYHVIQSKVDRDLYDVLDVKNNQSTDRTLLKKKFQEAKERLQAKKEKIRESGEDYTDEDEEIELEEISDALEILSNNEARSYYNLYGEKPPEAMKHLSAKHGGWGQEMAFARNIHMKIILNILKYLDSWWADMGIIFIIFLFMGITVWMKLPELLELAEMIEAHDARMKEIDQKQG